MANPEESTAPTQRHLRFDTLAQSYRAESDFWKNRALVLQDDLLIMAEQFAQLQASYDALKKNSKPTRPPASPTEPVETCNGSV
jgi:hypothetical protein